jgi:hypothetical protein
LGQVAFEIPQAPESKNQNSGGGNNADNTDNAIGSESNTKNETSLDLVSTQDLDKFIGYGLYFENNSPNC